MRIPEKRTMFLEVDHTTHTVIESIDQQLRELNKYENFDENTTVDDVVLMLENHDYCNPNEVVYIVKAHAVLLNDEFQDFIPNISEIDSTVFKSTNDMIVDMANTTLENAYHHYLNGRIEEYLKYV